MFRSNIDSVKAANMYPTCMPFAHKTEDKGTISPTFTNSSLCCPFGFASSYTVPVTRGGTPLTMTDMNTWGHAGTVGSFLHFAGFKPTFRQSVAEKIGGYSKGTILYDYSNAYQDDGSKYAVVREVISLQDNNFKNFVYDAGVNPSPYEIGAEDDHGIVWWDYVYYDNEYSLMAPNYSDRTLIVKIQDITRTLDGDITWTSTDDGWYNIEVTSENEFVRSDVITDKVYDNSVYHFGLTTTTDGWDKKTGTDVDSFKIFSNKTCGRTSVIVPTNKGIVHQIRCNIQDSESPLSISVYKLGLFHRPSE